MATRDGHSEFARPGNDLRAAQVRRLLRGRYVIVAGVAAASIAAGVFSAASGSAQSSEPTFGLMPDNLRGSRLDISRIPDFVQTVDREGDVVGYVRREDLMPVSPDGAILTPTLIPIVYARDGKTVLGRMITGVGFVRAGESGADTARVPVTVVQVP